MIGGQPYMTLTYHQRPNLDVAGVNVSVLTSTDMVNWAPPTNATTAQMGTDSNGNTIMQVQVPAPASGGCLFV